MRRSRVSFFVRVDVELLNDPSMAMKDGSSIVEIGAVVQTK